VKKNFAGTALALTLINALARLLGFVRETAVAAVFGASPYTDAYQVAYSIPYSLQMVLGVTLVSLIVPLMVRSVETGKEEDGWIAASSIINITVLLMALASVAGVLGAGLLVRITAPGFKPAWAALATTMTALMFPSVAFISAAMLITGILNAYQRFVAAALAPALSSLVIIFGVVFFGARFDLALPLATLISFVCMLLIQLPALEGTGFRYRLTFDVQSPLVKGVFSNLGAVFLGTATYQFYLFINRYFASTLQEGSISALNYASKLMNLPLGLFVTAISASIFPLLSALAAAGDEGGLWESLNRGLALVLLVTLPAAAGLMALGQPIVRLLFERSAFTAGATAMTARALFWFGPGMGAMAATQVLTRAFYALEDTRTPMFFGLSSIAVNIAASALLVRPMTQGGLALANSLASLYYALGMYAALLRRLPGAGPGKHSLTATLAKALAASAAAALAAAAAWRLCDPLFAPLGGKGLLAAIGLSIIAGISSYIVVIFLLKENEALSLLRQFRRPGQKKAGKS